MKLSVVILFFYSHGHQVTSDAGCPPFMAGQASGQPGSRATTLETYRKIVGGQLSIPTHINPPARVRKYTSVHAVSHHKFFQQS